MLIKNVFLVTHRGGEGRDILARLLGLEEAAPHFQFALLAVFLTALLVCKVFTYSGALIFIKRLPSGPNFVAI